MNASSCARPALRAVSAIFLLALFAAATTSVAHAEDPGTEIQALRLEVEALRRRDEESRAKMAELERLLHQVLEAQSTAQPSEPVASGASPSAPRSSATETASSAVPAPVASPQQALDRALSPAGPSSPTVASTSGAAPGDVWATPVAGGAAQVRLIDIAFSTNVAAGGSSVGNEALSQLQAGGHDPNQNGFTLQQAELSFTGAVDPYFTAEAHIVGTDKIFELEEAFLTTTSLPYGLQVEAGYSLTEFGIINPSHVHSWDWMDQPVINSRLFGGDGTRSPGARLAWLLPTPFFSELHVGVQDANDGDFTPSFIGEDGVGGRPNLNRDVRGLDDLLWLVRSNSSWDLSPETALVLGASGLYGPNATGGDGETWIYGLDAKLRWRPQDNFRGWPFVLWQTEAIGRSFKADAFTAGTDVDPTSGEFPNDLPGSTLHDAGFYTQLLYGFRYGWSAGLRAEYVTGSGKSVVDGMLESREGDSLRDNRLRLSPLLVWHPTEFSRLRLQYNFDDADHLSGNDAHTVWIGAEVLYGKHAAHKY